MEKVESPKNLPPIEKNKELQDLFKFLEEKIPEQSGIGKEVEKRTAYWGGVISNLNKYVEKGELSKEKRESYIAKLIAFKEQSPGNDFLTGLPTRENYEEMISREINIATRNKTPLTLLVIDVDNLKEWNDLIKDHDIGDQVIVSTAEAIKSNVRESDFSARWGGDEFVVILPRTKKKEAQLIVKRILGGVENSKPILDRKFSISIGVKEWKESENKEGLFKKADEAAYNAKGSKNKFIIAET